MEGRPGCRPVGCRTAGADLSKILLDTTFLIDAERSGDELDDAISDDDEAAIAAITVAELRVGALLADRKHRADRVAFLDDVLLAIPMLDYDQPAAEAHAELLVQVRKQGTRRGAHELIIAATAMASGRTLLTADEGAFADLPGVQVRSRR